MEVLTSKTCSEEGLEDVTALLLNLSGPEATRDTILSLLLQGAQELGNVVRQNILDLQRELLGLKGIEPGTSAAASAASEQPSEDAHASSHHDKGAVIDRFTREAVVISAPSKVNDKKGMKVIFLVGRDFKHCTPFCWKFFFMNFAFFGTI